jgi:CBS domain-containing protein
VYDAIQRMTGHRIGGLAVTEGNSSTGKVIGIITERDYLSKLALLGKASKSTNVSEICTYGVANLVIVNHDEPVDDCMRKMLARDIRHLLVRGDDGEIESMLSIKDLVKVTVAKHDAIVRKLTSYALGDGANN